MTEFFLLSNKQPNVNKLFHAIATPRKYINSAHITLPRTRSVSRDDGQKLVVSKPGSTRLRNNNKQMFQEVKSKQNTVHNFGFWTNFTQIGVKTAGKQGNKKHCSPCLVEAYKVWSVAVWSVLLSPTFGKTMHKILNQLFPVNNLSIDSFLFFRSPWCGVGWELDPDGDWDRAGG